MRSSFSLQTPRFSIATLLVVTLLAAVYLAIARFDFLLVPLAFPFTHGPIAAYCVNKTKYSLVIGTLSSALFSLVGIGPLILIGWFLVGPFGWIDERLLTRSLIASATLSYFTLVSLLGGYLGGIAAGPD